jgi:hypothetical protein
MKQLIAGIALIVVLGVGGFLYRNTLERVAPPPSQAVQQTACTEEARICPDGSSVSRMGPACAFSACPPPNVERADVGVAFVLPQGYTATGDNTYGKPSLSGDPKHIIRVRSYTIPPGETLQTVLFRETVFQPADMRADSMSDFELVVIGGKTFYKTVIERFEAQVMSSYYLEHDGRVLRFDIEERDVTEWTNPNLVIETLPEHRALLTLLETMQLR